MENTIQDNPNKIHCTRCQRVLNRNQFYLDKNGNPFDKCKKMLNSGG